MSSNLKFVLQVCFAFVFLIVFFVLLGWLSTTASEEKRDRNEFIGACNALNGTVHDDVCVSDETATVVLTRDEYEEEYADQ